MFKLPNQSSRYGALNLQLTYVPQQFSESHHQHVSSHSPDYYPNQRWGGSSGFRPKYRAL